jgi:hypothetical protein
VNSSSSSSSPKFHSIEGKAIDSSTCLAASVKSDMLKDPIVLRDRFVAVDRIIGFSFEITWLGAKLRAFSRAWVAGDWGLQVDILIVVKLELGWRVGEFMRKAASLIIFRAEDPSMFHCVVFKP